MSDHDTVDDAVVVNQANDNGNNFKSIPEETNQTLVSEIANETIGKNNAVSDNSKNDNQLNGTNIFNFSSKVHYCIWLCFEIFMYVCLSLS